MYLPAVIVLALLAGFFGALVEWFVNAQLRSAFAARMLGLAVFGIVLLLGVAGPFAVYLRGR